MRSTTDLSSAGGWPQAVAVDSAGNSYVSIEVGHYPWTSRGIVEIDPTGQVVRTLGGGGDHATVTPAGDRIYVTRGVQLDGTQWTDVRAFEIPKS